MRQQEISRIFKFDENFDLLHREAEIGGRKVSIYSIDGFLPGDTIEKLMQFFYSIKDEDMPENLADFISRSTPFVDIMEIKTERDICDWNNGKIQIALAHPASCGHGLNLQRGGSTIIWFGLTWSLELYQQANARLYRQGQNNTVVVHHIVTKGTVDEDVMTALNDKDMGQASLMEAIKARMEGIYK